MNVLKALLAITCLLVNVPSKGQQYFYKQYSVAEGLAQSTVFKAIQDSRGIYWLGTQAGVSSFDGIEFSNFSSSSGLAENGVRAICESKSGTLWFGHTGGGVSRFDGKSFLSVNNFDSLIHSNITSIVEDRTGHLWIATEASGVMELMNPDASVVDLQIRKYQGSEISDRVFNSYMDPAGRLYFVADPNVKIYNPDSLRFDNLEIPGIPRYYATTCILVDSKGRYWFGKYNGGLYCHNPEDGVSHMYDLIEEGLNSNWVSTLHEDAEGRIWAGTWGGGIIRLGDRDSRQIFHAGNGLPGNKIWSISQDLEGNILVGTQGNGLCVYKGDHFVSWNKSDGLTDPQVWSVLQRSKGDIWIGTSEGITVIDYWGMDGALRPFDRLKGSRVTFLEEDSRKTVWIGSLNQGVYSYDRHGNYRFEALINNNIYDHQLKAMELDGDDNLWIGTMEGLVYYEIGSGKVARLTQEHGLRGNDISALFAGSDGKIWVGSEGKGISLIEGDSVERPDLGFVFTPRCFSEDLDGNIWIGTEGRGILCYDPVQDRLLGTWSEQEGLLANLINLIVCDSFNNVYIGTNKGLNVYAREENRIFSFTPSSGFVGIETNPQATLADRDGNLWFGTVNGLIRYAPPAGGLNFPEPVVRLTGFDVNHENFPLHEGQRFSHRQNSIIFTYRCLTLNQDAVQYQIMLEGVDQEWRPPDIMNSVTYPALRFGKYTFQVRARSSSGVWNSRPLSFSFEINPPFYLTWYFILSAILILNLGIFTYIKVRERALRRENAILEEKVRDRTATVVAQKEELSQKNKNITDSIRYAKRIQFAILPENPPFEDTFIMFKPKDIVSGDFYWFTELGGRQFFAAVDCTGHGVPGAFMSIIGHSSLNKIVREYGILEPGEILTRLNKEVIGTLRQRSDSGDVLDGMDLALACYHPEKGLLEYAGAFNPLYLVRKGELMEIKADKVSIGRSSFREDARFSNQKIDIQAGDTVYLFSDGYADQFGGEQMKKFKNRGLKELLLRIQDRAMEEQRNILARTIEEWMGEAVAQIDDILVVGRRF